MASILEQRLNSRKTQKPEDINEEKNPVREEETGNEKGRSDTEEDPMDEEDLGISDEDLKFLRDLEEATDEQRNQKFEKNRKGLRILSLVVLSAACVYLVMLVYGAWITQFSYGEDGKTHPVILTPAEIDSRNGYLTALNIYYQARTIYEEILSLDYRMQSKVEDPVVVSTEYENILEKKILPTINQVKGTGLRPAYNQVKNMIQTWLGDVEMAQDVYNAATYCQFVSTAYSQNDEYSLQQAVYNREAIYSDFQTITSNMITIGESLKGIDVSDLKSWSPEKYIEETFVEASGR